jgi:hypothetical protein
MLEQKNFKIVTLRDYVFNANNSDVISFNSDKSLWHLVPNNERLWLERFMQNRTPFSSFTENGFESASYLIQLLNQIPDWIKTDRAYKVIRAELPAIKDKRQRYNVYRYFIDHYVTSRIKLKYIGWFGEGIEENEETAKLRSENNFNLWFSDFVAGWGNNNGGWLNGIWNVVKAGANFIIPGVSVIIDNVQTTVEQSGLNMFQAKNGEQLYFPQFEKGNRYSTDFEETGNYEQTGNGLIKAGSDSFIFYLIGAGLLVTLLLNKGK